MSPPNSDLFKVKDIPGAGRGVVATKSIPKDTLILQSGPPAAHVIFRIYRKEVCSQCFHYALGSKLPVQHQASGKFFCTQECRTQWLNEQGELGLKAWGNLRGFLEGKRKAILKAERLLSFGDRPDEDAIRLAWAAVDAIAERQSRRFATSTTTMGPSDRVQALTHATTQAVDPNILEFLLSALLSKTRGPEHWRNNILDLAPDERAYNDASDLEAHCNSYLQLDALLPPQLSPTFNTSFCQALITATNHNAFGIRAGGGEDREEYMGYALYPSASYFNHSCDPNLGKKQVGRVWEVRAVRDVGVGEECCISYLGGDEESLGVGERRERLSGSWGFWCGCRRCERDGGL